MESRNIWSRLFSNVQAGGFAGALEIVQTHNFSAPQSFHNFVTNFGDPSSARSGCEDPFAIFGFLAFLLALIQILIDQNNAGNGRRKRSLDGNSLAFQQATLAALGMLQGFINTINSGNKIGVL